MRNSASLLSDIFDITQSVVKPIGKTPGLILANLVFQPIPPAYTVPGFGQNSLGYRGNDGPLVNILIGFDWLHAADDAKFRAASEAVIQRSQTAARDQGRLHPVEYLNYAAEWQDPIASYGAAEKKRLQAVSKKYDPRGIFQKAVPGGFKLF